MGFSIFVTVIKTLVSVGANRGASQAIGANRGISHVIDANRRVSQAIFLVFRFRRCVDHLPTRQVSKPTAAVTNNSPRTMLCMHLTTRKRQQPRVGL